MNVTWVVGASSSPMGQQRHEDELQAALGEAADGRFGFSLRRVAPLRAGSGDVRLPTRLLRPLPARAAALAGKLAYGRADLVHRFDLRLPPRRGAEVVTVHDLPPLRFPDEGDLPRWASAGARGALGVLCPSSFAADEVSDLLGVERVWVVPNGVSPVFFEADGDVGVPEPFVLHAGGATLRKNLAALAGAWRRVAAASEATLMLCGPPDTRRDELFADLPRVRFLGHLAQADVAALMRRSAAVVVPSLYEGFGLPALEGMAAGAPVVAARRGALPEVCGDAALLVEPTAKALAESLLAVLGDNDLARRLRAEGPRRAAGFTWHRAAELTLAAYEEALAR